MKSIKANLVIASAIGALIAAVLLLLERPTDYALLSLEWPGISAAYLFWGVVGGPAFMGIAIAWLVNAIVYATAALFVLLLLKLLTRVLPEMMCKLFHRKLFQRMR